MKVTDVIRRPLVTEKTTVARETSPVVVFEVARNATKIDIKRAVEEAFEHKIHVVDVNTITMRGKVKTRSRRGGGRVIGRTSKWKKAIITLAPGEKIDNLYENV